MGPRRYALALIAALTLLIAFFVSFTVVVDAVYNLSAGWYLVLVLGTSLLAGTIIGLSILAGIPLIDQLMATRRSLVELDSLNHPLMIELQRRAPGTYHHSLAVADLAFQAAKAIGANPRLARIGAFYHDVGKMKDPGMFIENINPKNDPHLRMEPKQSAQIIIKHIIDGMEIAERYNLPDEVADFIPEHTGTTLVYYFYVKAKQQAKKGVEVYKRDFRYPGPKPLRKETAIVMLADTVEAAVRAHAPATDAKLRAIIDQVVKEKLDDRQLDLSGMTDGDVTKAKEAFAETLTRMHHRRIKYPKQSKAL